VTPPHDIRERTFTFSKSVILFCRTWDNGDYVIRRLAGQLARAAASVGANLEEAADAQSKPDFISKNSIALKECRETRYWLRLIGATEPRAWPAVHPLIREADQLIAILRTIVINAKRNGDRGSIHSR
jgi:four helix bundle protein